MSFGSFNTFNPLIQSVKIFLNPPTFVSAIVSSSTVVSVAFTAPGGTITNYTATSSPGGFVGNNTTSPITVSGLTPNTVYTFSVTATNSGGTSVASSSSTAVTTRTIAPTIGTATASSTTAVSVAFTAPSGGNGLITNYTVTSSPGGFVGNNTTSPITVSGLTANTAYTFSVTATNSGGTSVASSSSTAATTISGSPTSVVATVSSTTAVSVAFTPPSGSGLITNYTVTSSPGGFVGNNTSSPVTVSGLSSNTIYTFTVRATNSGGISAASSASTAVTTITGPPILVSETSLSTTAISVAFTAPSGNGLITNYIVTSSPGGISSTGTNTTSPITVSGLSANTIYSFTITATNSGGTSASTVNYANSSKSDDYNLKLSFGISTTPPTGSLDDTGTKSLQYVYTQGRVNTLDVTRGWVFSGLSIQFQNNYTTTSSFTRSCWTYGTAVNSGNKTMHSTSCSMQISTGSTYSAILNGTSIIDPYGDRGLNTWVHQAITYNGTTLILYINGVSVGSATPSAYTGTDTALYFLSTNNAAYFTGLGDNVLCYTRALSATEINTIYTYELSIPIATTIPNAPIIGTATVSSSTAVSVAFIAPGGTATISYTVTSSPGGLVGTGSPSPITIIDTSNLVLYYPFNSTDLSGSTIANLATGNLIYDASMTGTTTITGNQMSTLTSGTTQNGFLINRNIPRTGFTGITFSFWFTATTIPDSSFRFLTTLQDVSGSSGGNRIYITINPSNKLSINEEFITSLTVVVNTLYHIVVTINSTGTPNTTVYVNNVSQTGTCTYPTFTNVSGYNTIGRDRNGNGLLGTLDDYRLYNRSITAGEVNTLYNAGTSVLLPITVSGLTPNTSYTFTATATNSGGTSVASSASSAVTTMV